MHGLSPDDEIDYWRERAERAEADNERMRAVYEAAVEWSESFGELSKRLPPHVHKLRAAVDAALAAKGET